VRRILKLVLKWRAQGMSVTNGQHYNTDITLTWADETFVHRTEGAKGSLEKGSPAAPSDKAHPGWGL
jgi:hypothetical protein